MAETISFTPDKASFWIVNKDNPQALPETSASSQRTDVVLLQLPDRSISHTVAEPLGLIYLQTHLRRDLNDLAKMAFDPSLDELRGGYVEEDIFDASEDYKDYND